MQRLAAGMLRDTATQNLIADSGAHYAARNRAFVALLAERGVHAQGDDGLNVWVDVQGDTAEAARRLALRGWLARSGAEFALDPDGSTGDSHLRLTVHDLDEADTQRLVEDLATAIAGVRATGEGA